MKLKELTDYLDNFLDVKNISDSAYNGLQVEGGNEVFKIALATDFCKKIANLAIENKCQMILCHHGICWPTIQSITGITKQRIKTLLLNDISLYGVHLPLDKHLQIGNNAVIVELLSAQQQGEFGISSGSKIGLVAKLPKPLHIDELQSNFDKLLNTNSFLIKAEQGKEYIENIGVISGGGAGKIGEAACLELDVLITGETSHSNYYMAKESGTHLLCGGHYKTETTGIKALGKHLEDKFKLETVFFELPTGL